MGEIELVCQDVGSISLFCGWHQSAGNNLCGGEDICYHVELYNQQLSRTRF